MTLNETEKITKNVFMKIILFFIEKYEIYIYISIKN